MNRTCCGHVFPSLSLYRCLLAGEYCKTGKGKNKLNVDIQKQEFGICPVCMRESTPKVIDNFSIRSETKTYIVTDDGEYRLSDKRKIS